LTAYGARTDFRLKAAERGREREEERFGMTDDTGAGP